jgi:tetratricopeptide (TPR) repeat protein
MSVYAPTPESAPTEAHAELRIGHGASKRTQAPWPALAVVGLTAALLCLAAFAGEAGQKIEGTTTVELVLTLVSGVTIALATLLAPVRRRIDGLWTIALLLAFTGVTAASISWSVTPNTSWQEASMMLAYTGVFIAAAALVRAAPARTEAVLGGVVLAAVIVSGYALLTKVFPSVGPHEWARLIGAFGYWNATGIAAGMGIVACLWLGSRRVGHALLRVLAYPAAGLLIVTLMLAYSRGALVVTLIGVALWLCVVPLRLRAATLLIAAAGCAAGVVAFDFAKASLSGEEIAFAARTSGGHELGVLLIALVLALLLIGVLAVFATDRRPPSAPARRRAGAALLTILVLAVLAGLGGIAASHRGFTGTISHAVSSLTNPNAPVPANTPNRLTAVSSVRARYWKEALEVFEAHPAVGSGAGGYATASLRYKPARLEALNAHGYVVQTLADLGVLGTALTLLLLIAWAVASGAATHPFNRRWSSWRWVRWDAPYTPERIALLSMLCVVVTFGIDSLVDWTWYAPGVACGALICAGWLVGRGPLHEPTVEPEALRWRHLLPSRTSNLRLAGAAAAILLALLAAWVEWQPDRSFEESQSALALSETSPARALAVARSAVNRDPLSPEAMFTLAAIQQEGFGRTAAAAATLRGAVRTQPANPETWSELGEHELESGHPKAAVDELGAALYLDPSDPRYQAAYLQALRASQTGGQ